MSTGSPTVKIKAGLGYTRGIAFHSIERGGPELTRGNSEATKLLSPLAQQKVVKGLVMIDSKLPTISLKGKPMYSTVYQNLGKEQASGLISVIKQETRNIAGKTPEPQLLQSLGTVNLLTRSNQATQRGRNNNNQLLQPTKSTIISVQNTGTLTNILGAPLLSSLGPAPYAYIGRTFDSKDRKVEALKSELPYASTTQTATFKDVKLLRQNSNARNLEELRATTGSKEKKA